MCKAGAQLGNGFGSLLALVAACKEAADGLDSAVDWVVDSKGIVKDVLKVHVGGPLLHSANGLQPVALFAKDAPGCRGGITAGAPFEHSALLQCGNTNTCRHCAKDARQPLRHAERPHELLSVQTTVPSALQQKQHSHAR